MQQTFTNPSMNNIQQQQQQQQHHQYHQLMTHLSPHEDPHHILTEHHHQQHHQPHQQQYNQHHQGYIHMPSSTTMSPQPLITSLNEQGLGGCHYTPLVTSEGLSQYCSSSEVSSLLNCSTTSTSSSSSASSSSHDCNSLSLSRVSSISDISEKGSTPSIGVNLRVTGQCSQGGRKYMEDYFSVAYQQSENAKDLEYAFIGIYDGHGGAEAATFAKEHLMMEIINQRLFWSDSDHDILRAIREGYIATHYAMWRQQDKWPKTANGLPSTAGTTATVAFIRREKIYIGHVGDSGIVLGYQNENENFWRAKQLTEDHKPESLEERTRIMNSGGKVVVKSGVPRVVWNRPRNANHRGPIKQKTAIDEIPFLAVARSLGDLWSYNSERNEFVVSPDPDVKVIPINSKTFRCLIFGTDGLWNVVNPQEAVNTVREKELINEHLQAQRGDSPHDGNQWTNPSKSLVDQALKTWSNKKMRADNTSVVTVILYPPGQGGHNNNLHPSSNIAPPPAFAQPASYGLEYTQVQAEIPGYDNATTYKEMAIKYLPPEEYRNFNYYAEDSDPAEDADTDESDEEGEDSEATVVTKTTASLDTSVDPNGYPLHTSTWNWEHNSTISQSTNLQGTEEKSKCDDAEEEEEESDEDEDEEEEEDENAEESAATNHCQPANERELCVINYQNYLHVGGEEAKTTTNSYVSTYAESYNTVITADKGESLNDAVDTKHEPASVAAVITPTNSNSNSNSSNCQSVSPPNMHALIEEQQMYQQQCMSQEEGYSLTKLETRREQQSCKPHGPQQAVAVGVEMFKIFHQQQNSQTLEAYTSSTERYYQQHTGFVPQLQQKPLELHSLLQQEREEEQQVAFERQQMQNKLAVNTGHHNQHNITAYACLQAVRHDPEPTTSIYPATVSMLERATNPMEVDNDEYIEEVEVDVEMVADLTAVEEEHSVQINEVSSSSSCVEMDGEYEKFVVPDSPLTTPRVRAPLEKFDSAKEVVYEMHKPQKKRNAGAVHCINNRPLNSKRSTFKLSNSNSCLPSTSSPMSLNTPPARSSGKRSRSFIFANVPNENMDRTAYKPQSSLRRSLSMTPSCSNKLVCNGLLRSPPAASSTPMISRQLRSNTSNCNPNTPLDYGKRTLRTRNSLAKDMKSKSSLVQAALKYPHHNSVTRKFLRTSAAAALLGGSPAVLMQEQHMTSNNRRSLNANNNGHNSANRSIKPTRNSSTNTPSSLSQPQTSHHLNLRSRQSSAVPISTSQMLNLNSEIGSLHGESQPPPPPSSTLTPVLKRVSLADRRNLRSMHTRSSSRVGPSVQTSFSKTTKSQSTGTNLAAPPPSPKMINAAAVAVAAATRARSLLSHKHNAEVNGRRSVVTAVFGKRGNLRSNGLTSLESGAAAIDMIPISAAPVSSSGGEAPSMRTSTAQQTLRGRIVKKFKH